jgi:hypothetical protein
VTAGAVRGTLPYGDSWAPQVASRLPVIGAAVILGQSNANGTTSYAGYSEVDVAEAHPGLSPTIWHQGALLETYPELAVGPVPRLVELMGAEDPAPVVVRRSINGANTASVRGAQIEGALADLATIGVARDDVGLVWVVHGEDASQSEAAAVEYRDSELERICRICEGNWPRALVAISLLRSDAYGEHFAIVRDAQRAVAARRASRRLVDTLLPTALPLTDTVHYSSGSGGGYEQAADRLWAALGA